MFDIKATFIFQIIYIKYFVGDNRFQKFGWFSTVIWLVDPKRKSSRLFEKCFLTKYLAKSWKRKIARSEWSISSPKKAGFNYLGSFACGNL